MSDARSGARDAGTRPDTEGPGGRPGGPSDFQASVQRLERAVSELVATASDRASSLIDETAQRLERELDRRQRQGGRHRGRHRHRHGCGSGWGYHSRRYTRTTDEGPPRRLYRDPSREKIGGVCAGIARYYGMEPWVVRCIAVTGLLFFPTIVFPAYWIAYFVMDKPPKSDADKAPDDAPRGRRDHRSPAPELGPRFSPRYSLRNVQADLAEVELRLRRMETHVTSGQYELQRELNKIDGGGDGQRS
ncbi:MAG TPA: PspC domain-containing protein [Pseudomonadales bacterium]